MKQTGRAVSPTVRVKFRINILSEIGRLSFFSGLFTLFAIACSSYMGGFFHTQCTGWTARRAVRVTFKIKLMEGGAQGFFYLISDRLCPPYRSYSPRWRFKIGRSSHQCETPYKSRMNDNNKKKQWMEVYTIRTRRRWNWFHAKRVNLTKLHRGWHVARPELKNKKKNDRRSHYATLKTESWICRSADFEKVREEKKGLWRRPWDKPSVIGWDYARLLWRWREGGGNL